MMEMTASRESAQREASPARRPSARVLDFEALYQAFAVPIYRYCLRRVDGHQEAEDLTAQVFTRALAGCSEYRGGSQVAWLFRIAHNTLANHLRDRKPTVPLDLLESAGAVPALSVLSADEPEALAQIVQKEEYAQILELVAALPEEQQELVHLRFEAGLAAREIGEFVGKNEGAVRVALYRIVQHLRAAWARGEEEEG